MNPKQKVIHVNFKTGFASTMCIPTAVGDLKQLLPPCELFTCKPGRVVPQCSAEARSSLAALGGTAEGAFIAHRPGNSLVVQRLRVRASAARIMGLIPGWGTKILQAAWCDSSSTSSTEHHLAWGIQRANARAKAEQVLKPSEVSDSLPQSFSLQLLNVCLLWYTVSKYYEMQTEMIKYSKTSPSRLFRKTACSSCFNFLVTKNWLW